VGAVMASDSLAGIIWNVRIPVKKNIPIGLGLGGGSSDAAVTFIGLQRMFKRPLPFEQVPQVLRELGSDVPFFALGGRAAGYGRGDDVYKLDDGTDYWVLLVYSVVVLPTA